MTTPERPPLEDYEENQRGPSPSLPEPTWDDPWIQPQEGQ